MEVKIYLTNLAKYNEGELVGKWIELPLDETDLKNEIAEVLGNDEEYFITDHEAPFKIWEHDNPYAINKQVEEIQQLSAVDQEVLEIILKSDKVESIDEGLTIIHEGSCIIYRECSDMKDVVLQYIEMFGGFKEAMWCPGNYINVPDHYENISDMSNESIKKYFDIEQYIKDVVIESHYEKLDNNMYVQFLN